LERENYGYGPSRDYNGFSNIITLVTSEYPTSFNIHSLESLSFIVTVMINRIIDKDQEILYDREISVKSRRIQWIIEGNLLQRIQTSARPERPHEVFQSELLGRMACLMIICDYSENVSETKVWLRLSPLLSRALPEIDAFVETECILKGKDIDQRISDSDFHKFDTDYYGRAADADYEVIPGKLQIKDIQKCQSLTFNINIELDPGQDKALEHWKDVFLRQSTKENEVLLRKWMKDELKLPQYLSTFKENGFENLEDVSCLQYSDLKEMGVNKLGHRRRIMACVQKLKEADHTADHATDEEDVESRGLRRGSHRGSHRGSRRGSRRGWR